MSVPALASSCPAAPGHFSSIPGRQRFAKHPGERRRRRTGKAPGWTPAIAFDRGTKGTRAPGWAGRDPSRAGEIPPAEAQLADTEPFSRKKPCTRGNLARLRANPGPCRSDALGMCYYLRQRSLAGSSPPGLSTWLGAPTAFASCWKWPCTSGAGIFFFRQGVQLDREKLTARPGCCTRLLCAGFANALPRLLAKRSRHTQMQEFHSFPASK